LSGDRIRQCETSSGSRHKDMFKLRLVMIEVMHLYMKFLLLQKSTMY